METKKPEVRPFETLTLYQDGGGCKLCSEAEVRDALASLDEKSGVAVFSRSTTPPVGFQSWKGIYLLGTAGLSLGDCFEEESFGTMMHEGKALNLVKLVRKKDDSAFLIGREDVLKPLCEAVAAKRAEIHHVTATAGMGKTTLLKKFLSTCRLPANQIYQTSFSLGAGSFLSNWQKLARLPKTSVNATQDGVIDRLSQEMADAIGESGYALIVLDDCHWISPSDITILRRLLNRLENQVLLVMFSRPLEEGSPLSGMKKIDHELAPFQLDELKMLIAHFWPNLPDLDFAAAQLDHVTGGHPLLSSEILQSPSFDKTLPDLADRVKSLPRAVELAAVCESNPALSRREDREILGVLACLRRPFSAGLADSIVTRFDLEGEWRAGLSGGLLVETQAGRYAFRHALIQAACSEWLESQPSHSAMAQVLKEHQDYAEAAYHYEQDEALELAKYSHLRAASMAFEQGDLGSAAQQFKQALLDVEAPRSAKFEDYWQGGMALYAFGRHDEAAELLERGIQLEPKLRYRASKRVALRGWLSTLLPSNKGGLSDEEVQLYSRGVQALRICAEVSWYRHDQWGCLCAIAQATVLSRSLPDSAGVAKARVYPSSAMVYGFALPEGRRRSLLLKSFRFAREQEPTLRFEVAMVAGSFYCGLKDWRRARFLVRASRRGALRVGNEMMAVRAACLEVMDHFYRGELTEGIELCDEMIKIARGLDSDHISGLLRMMRGLALADLESPQLCLRTCLTIDPVVRTLHSFEILSLEGAIGYLMAHNREHYLEVLDEALNQAAAIAHTIYSSQVVFIWLADALMVAQHRGEVPVDGFKRLKSSLKKHALLFPAGRNSAALIQAVIAKKNASPAEFESAVRPLLEKAKDQRIDYIVRWAEGHLGVASLKGIKARCKVIEEALAED